MSHIKALFDTLTEKERKVLGLIAINQDGGHSPVILIKLLKLGLIESHRDPFLTRRFGLRNVNRYRMPMPIHLNWCEWCSENITEEEMISD